MSEVDSGKRLMALIAKLESAAVGSVDLDEAISDAFGIDRRECCGNGVQNHPEEPPECCGNPIETEPLRYTASIDAALTLVDPTLRIEFEMWTGDGDKQRHAYACIEVLESVDTTAGQEMAVIYNEGRGNGPNAAAVALCIAALKARQAGGVK